MLLNPTNMLQRMQRFIDTNVFLPIFYCILEWHIINGFITNDTMAVLYFAKLNAVQS